MEITGDEIVAILKRHHVAEDEEVLQNRYRRQLGQRLMASLRDDDGKREVMSNGKGQYFVVECCRDQKQLQSIQRRIQNPDTGPGCHSRQGAGAHPCTGAPESTSHARETEKGGMSTPDNTEKLKWLYRRLAPQHDPDGFRLYSAARRSQESNVCGRNSPMKMPAAVSSLRMAASSFGT